MSGGPKDPIVLIHGYSDRGRSFAPWVKALLGKGYEVAEIPVCTYKSLTNEVTIKDVAEGFDRALRARGGLADGRPFNAIVHSTGMLVVRSWLTTYEGRRKRLKRLVGLAPATFGSPLAHQGRGPLGAVFKGNKLFGPDFLEAGDKILDGLELGSRFTWDLTHADLLCDRPFYGEGADTPYVFIFCGTDGYSDVPWLARKLGTEGSDGTVRWAGCSLNTQKFCVDFTRDAAEDDNRPRVKSSDIDAKRVLPMPFWPVADKNHGTIVSDPGDALIDLVHRALQVGSKEEFAAWQEYARQKTERDMPRERWQQFVVHAMDERGDPVQDYYLELSLKNGTNEIDIGFDLDVHPYSADRSFRCFHVNLTKLERAIADAGGGSLCVRVIASSGSTLVGYHGVGSQKLTKHGEKMNRDGVWDAQMELPGAVFTGKVTLFYPFTTTFIELKLNRDPMPFGQEDNNVVGWEDMQPHL